MPHGIGWELFENYLIAREKFNPDLFLYENNKSAEQPIKDQISYELGAPIMHINSALVSAQNRERFYCFNWHVEQPRDRCILLRDILEPSAVEIDCERQTVACGWRGRKESDGKYHKRYESTNEPKANTLTTAPTDSMIAEPIRKYPSHHIRNVYEVRDGIIPINGEKYRINMADGYYIIRKPTVTECERLQTLPDGYTRAVSDAQRRKCLANGWTAEIIIHILNGALAGVPRNEEIVVLSMYDGIGTGRYCLDRMGFTNVRYYAYETDKYAKQISMSNYPDIIQCGDAYDLRHPGWMIGY